jgi:excisionase family DNA binding protein
MNPGLFNADKKVWVLEVPATDWYSVQDASIILNTGGPSVYNAINRGSLVAYKVGGSTRIKHEDLVDYISKRGRSEVRNEGIREAIEKIVPSAVEKTRALHIAGATAAEGRQPVGKINLSLFDTEDAEPVAVASESETE